MTDAGGADVGRGAWGRLLAGSDTWRWLLILGFLAFGIGLRSPWPADEPRFALVALDMVQHDHWLLPHRGGEIYADKPPLFMWLQAASYLATGTMKVAFLLPSLGAAMLTLWLVHDLTRRLAGREAAWYATFILLVTIQFTQQAKAARIDATLAAFTTLALYGFVRHHCLGPAPRWQVLSWLFMGLGILTKGVGFLPVFALPGVVVARGLRRRRLGEAITAPPWPAWFSPLLLLVPAALWLLPLEARSAEPRVSAYLNEILLRQTVTRYAEGLGHFKPVTYYVTSVIPVLWLPLSVLLPWLIPDWVRKMRRLSVAHWALVSYVTLGLVFFSASPGKRGVYLLPLLPAVAVLAGLSFSEIRRRVWPSRILRFITVGIGVILVAGAIATVFDLGPLSAMVSRADLPVLPVTAMLLACGVFWLGSAVALPRGGAFGVAMVVTWLLLTGPGYVLLDPVRSAEELMASVESHLDDDTELAIVGFKEQQLLQADRPIVHWSFAAPADTVSVAAASWLSADPTRRVLIAESVARGCFVPDPGLPVGYRHRREWRLVSATDLDPVVDCASRATSLARFTAPPSGYGPGRG